MLKQNVVLKYAIKIKLEILKRENMGKYEKIFTYIIFIA